MKVAVIVPVYNGGKFLPEFLSCLEGQSMKAFEVYFIDDCSTDNTSMLLQEAVEKNAAFHYMRNEKRRGAAATRNRGIECSRSEYVLCLDADDLIASDLIEQLVKAADTCDADMVMLERNDITKSGSVVRQNDFLNDDTELYIDRHMPYNLRAFQVKGQPDDFLVRCMNGTCDRMIKRELLDRYQIRFQDLPSSNDVFYILFSSFAAERIVHTRTSDFLYYRRIHSEEGRISNHRDPMCAFKALDAVRETLVQHHMWEECCVHFWVFALDSLEKQLFVCKDKERQRQVYRYLQEEGIRKLGVPDDILYSRLPEYYRKQFNRLRTLPYERKCFQDSMVFHALCEKNRSKISEIFTYAKQKNLKIGYWGVGRQVEGFMDAAAGMGEKIDYLIDNNKDKQGREFFGLKVVSYDTVFQEAGIIIVSNKQYYGAIFHQIKEMNADAQVLCIQEYLFCNRTLQGCIR